MAEAFGKKIWEARRKKGLTLRKLGELVGLSPSFLSEMEQGRRKPPKDEEKIKNLSIVLDLNFSELLLRSVFQKTQNLQFMGKINENLAWSLFRATENADEQEVEKAFTKALEYLEKGEFHT